LEVKPDRRAPSPQPSPRRGEGVNGPAPMIRMDLMSVRRGNYLSFSCGTKASLPMNPNCVPSSEKEA